MYNKIKFKKKPKKKNPEPTSWTSGSNISFFSLNAIDPNWPFDSLSTLDALFPCKP